MGQKFLIFLNCPLKIIQARPRNDDWRQQTFNTTTTTWYATITYN